MERLQCTGNQIQLQLPGHIQILIENELDLPVLLATPLYQSGTGMELYPAAAPDGHFRIHAAAAGSGLGNVLFHERTQIAGRNQFGEGHTLQPQIKPGDKIQIPKTDPLKVGRFVNADKGSQGLSSFPAKSSQQV